jgi:hypothetical protein
MSSADQRPRACPVCGRQAGRARDCAECGWTLQKVWRPGPVTAQLREDFGRRLSAAQRRFDAHAAALVSTDRDRLTSWIRGGRPDDVEWVAALREAAKAADGAADQAPACATVLTALRDLPSGSEAVIVEIGPEGIGVTRAALDRLGTPLLREQPVTPWALLVPLLSTTEEERLFQLAGGIATLDRDLLTGYLADATRLVTVPAEATGTLVVCQPAGWRILEEAARHLAAAAPHGTLIRVAGAPAEGNGVVGSLRKRMPLLRSYGLVVATIAPATGAISLGMRPLFQPGDAQGAESVLTLRRAPGDRDATTLAVAVEGETADSDGTTIDRGALNVLSLHEMPPLDEPVYRVRAVLEAPGRVRFTEPAGITPLGRSWPETAAAIPRRVDVLPGPVDLVCALELAGDKPQVDRRRDLIRDLLEHLDDEFTDPGQLRVGLLGCRDHVFAPGEERRPVVRRQPLGTPADALLALENFRGTDVRYMDAAPLEDLLHEAHRMLAGSSAQGRSARLLLVARRRPHPRILGPDLVQPCPFDCDWRRLAQGLAASGVPVVAVADVLSRRAATHGFWADVGQAGLHSLAETSARKVGADLGVTARPGQRIGIPLPA